MQLTLQQIITKAQTLLSVHLDSYVAPTDTADWITIVNQAQSKLGRDAYLVDLSVPLTLTQNVNEYDLRGPAFGRKMVEIARVYINGWPMLSADGRGYGMYSFPEFERLLPIWQVQTGPATSSGLSAACQYGTKLLLAPNVSATVAGYTTNFVAGHYIPADLTLAQLNSVPEIQEELHFPMAYLAAYYAAEPSASADVQQRMLAEYNSQYQVIVDRINRDNRSALYYIGTRGAQAYPSFDLV